MKLDARVDRLERTAADRLARRVALAIVEQEIAAGLGKLEPKLDPDLFAKVRRILAPEPSGETSRPPA